MLGTPEWSSIFTPNGQFLDEGEVIRRTAYAQTLHAVAEHGSEAFYSVGSLMPPLEFLFNLI